MKHNLIMLVLVYLILSLSGCGNRVPDDDEQPTDSENDTLTDANPDAGPDSGGSGDTDTGLPLAEDYYPMAVGMKWVYNETTAAGNQRTITYSVESEANDTFPYLGGDTIDFFVLKQQQSNETEWTNQFIENTPARAMRLRHQIFDANLNDILTRQRDYSPGFVRFDREKMTVLGAPYEETVTRYTDENPSIQTDAIIEETILYEFTVLSLHEELLADDVPAGPFTECIKVQRFSAVEDEGTVVAPETKTYWFAKGVGKVKEVTDNSKGTKTEVLASYTLP